jgi:hypothetical protein
LRTHKTKLESAAGTLLSRSVNLLLRSRFYLLSGDWSWDFFSDEVFCSDVILTVPPDNSGVRALIHPDDVNQLVEIFNHELPFTRDLEFRIITTYGEIKTLGGCDITITEDTRSVDALEDGLTSHLNDQKELEALRIQKAVYAAAEKITDSGIWYYNASIHETWYSDQVFRLHDLQPQTLNSHLYTFISFIHPEDIEQTKSFIEKAYNNRLPLHIEFRIVTSRGEKRIQYLSAWGFNEKGETVLSGIYKNITAEKENEQRMELPNSLPLSINRL